MFSFALFLFSNIFLIVTPYNYLIINPIVGFSHVKFMSKIADTLADNGHNVTLFQPFHLPMRNLDGVVKNKNVEIINFYPTHYDEMKNNPELTLPFMWEMPASPAVAAYMLPNMFAEDWNSTSTEVLRDAKLFSQLKNKKFDAVVVETFEISGIYLGHLLELPLIACMSGVRFAQINIYFGGNFDLGYVPAPGSRMGGEAGFLDRLNDVYLAIADYIFVERLMNKQEKICQEALGENVKIPGWKELFLQSTMYLVNSNSYIDFAVPNIGNIIPIGGFTIDTGEEKKRKVAKLPEEYDKILNERKHTVLISFGSVIRSFQMPDKFKSGIIEAMRKLPNITFIWKYEKDDDLEVKKKLTSNVHLKKWVPQAAILADLRLSLFVTHGGLGSTMEVAYSGIAALMFEVPIFADQPHNAMMLARHGGAIAYDRFELTNGEKLGNTINEMTENPIYKTKAVQLKNVLHSQPIDPKQLLVKSMEFAVKFSNFKSQVPEISSVGVIGYYYLDVFAFITAIVLFISYISLKVAILVFVKYHRSVVGSREKSKTE